MNTTTTDTAEPEGAAHAQRPRRLGTLGHAIDRRLERLQKDYLSGSPSARGDLARLRRGVGKGVADIPEVWEYTLTAVPKALQWDRDEPCPAELAAHAALTLYAANQQSMPIPAHRPGISFGRAAGELARAN